MPSSSNASLQLEAGGHAADVALLVRRHQGDPGAGSSGAGGPPDAVHVALVVLRRVVVHDVADPLEVETAGGDVGRDQDPRLPALEALERPLTGSLRHVAVQRLGHARPSA